MKIVLIRHGEPDFNIRWLMPTCGAKKALDAYAASRVTKPNADGMFDDDLHSGVCVTSKLPRAVDSAQLLGFNQAIQSDIFGESELPYPNRLMLPMPWNAFLFIYRTLWFFGSKQNCAGKAVDQQRAYEGGLYLSKLAEENDLVVVVGHGIMNRLLCSALKKMGWKVKKKTGAGYWSSITLLLETSSSHQSSHSRRA